MTTTTRQVRIRATERTSRRGAIELAQEFGYIRAEARAEQFLDGKDFVVTYDQADSFLPAQWRRNFRVKVLPAGTE